MIAIFLSFCPPTLYKTKVIKHYTPIKTSHCLSTTKPIIRLIQITYWTPLFKRTRPTLSTVGFKSFYYSHELSLLKNYYISDVSFRSSGSSKFNLNSNIVSANDRVTNGVIHIIDRPITIFINSNISVILDKYATSNSAGSPAFK